MIIALAIAPHTGARLAEFGFLLILIAGIWLAAAEVPALNLGNLKGIGAGLLLAVGALLLVIATHWGHFG